MYKKLFCKLSILIFSILTQTITASIYTTEKPRVLILRLKKQSDSTGWGGVAAHTISLYKNLLEAGIEAHILVPANSVPEEHLKNQNLPYFTFKDNASFNSKASDNFGDPESIYRTALDICEKYKINIIHINFNKEISIAKKLCEARSKIQKIDIVYQKHGIKQNNLKVSAFNGISAFISVDKSLIDQMLNEKKHGTNKINHIQLLPPITAISQNKKIDINLSKEEFFLKKFNIEINSTNPIVCCVAHFFQCKNHENLFKAVHKLIHEYKIPVQLLLAGEGTIEMSNYLKGLVKNLQLQDNVHFLGFVSDVPTLLTYSDMNVLVSKQESFGLAAIEASILKKPVIVSSGTGVANTFIIHNKTGLVCDPDSVEDIALQIKYLIDNPEIAKKFGDAAYKIVKPYYLSNGLTLEYIKIYTQIIKDNEKKLEKILHHQSMDRHFKLG